MIKIQTQNGLSQPTATSVKVCITTGKAVCRFQFVNAGACLHEKSIFILLVDHNREVVFKIDGNVKIGWTKRVFGEQR